MRLVHHHFSDHLNTPDRHSNHHQIEEHGEHLDQEHAGRVHRGGLLLGDRVGSRLWTGRQLLLRRISVSRPPRQRWQSYFEHGTGYHNIARQKHLIWASCHHPAPLGTSTSQWNTRITPSGFSNTSLLPPLQPLCLGPLQRGDVPNINLISFNCDELKSF